MNSICEKTQTNKALASLLERIELQNDATTELNLFAPHTLQNSENEIVGNHQNYCR